MTTHAILIGVRDTGATTDPAGNAIPAVSSMLRFVEGPLASSGIKCFLSSDDAVVSLDAVIAAFDQLEDVLTDNDTILVMFAGHGIAPAGKFDGWALSGKDKFRPADLWTQLARYPNARWIVVSDCCYGAAIIEKIGFVRRIWLTPMGILLTTFLRRDRVETRFNRLATSTITALTPSDMLAKPKDLMKDLIMIAGASAAEELSDGGQLLLATLLVGSALGQLTYDELDLSFRLVDVEEQSFVCQCPEKYHDASVLTWDPPPPLSVPIAGPAPVASVPRQLAGSSSSDSVRVGAHDAEPQRARHAADLTGHVDAADPRGR